MNGIIGDKICVWINHLDLDHDEVTVISSRKMLLYPYVCVWKDFCCHLNFLIPIVSQLKDINFFYFTCMLRHTHTPLEETMSEYLCLIDGDSCWWSIPMSPERHTWCLKLYRWKRQSCLDISLKLWPRALSTSMMW